MEADAQALLAHFASSGSGAACSGTPNVPPDDPEEVPPHDEQGEVKLTPCGLAAVGSEKEGSADDFWSGDVNEGPAGDDPGEKVGRGTGSGWGRILKQRAAFSVDHFDLVNLRRRALRCPGAPRKPGKVRQRQASFSIRGEGICNGCGQNRRAFGHQAGIKPQRIAPCDR